MDKTNLLSQYGSKVFINKKAENDEALSPFMETDEEGHYHITGKVSYLDKNQPETAKYFIEPNAICVELSGADLEIHLPESFVESIETPVEKPLECC